ncbi:ethanolaminephosphotransferase [Nematocida sp. AWRm77]|nr:ethanolaminephosphotransferase [Nematocida sp. AWRm77]
MWRKDLENLTQYKFEGTDDSFLYASRAKVYWNSLLEIIPEWVAPNVITMLGFLCMIFCFCVVLAFDRNLQGRSRLLTLLIAVSMWAYSTMDCLDGMQARKHKTGSPLGQLFDHGVDSIVCTLITFCMASAIGLENYRAYILMLSAGQSVFYWVTTKEFYAKKFYLGIIGPTELIAMCCVFLLCLSILGQNRVFFFKKKYPTLLVYSIFLGSLGVFFGAAIYFGWKIWDLCKFKLLEVTELRNRVSLLLPHALFTSLQLLVVRIALVRTYISDVWIMLCYVGLCTFSFSLFTIFTIYSHQRGTFYIEYPLFLPFLVILAGGVLKYISYKILRKYMTILFIIGALNYAYHIGSIISEITSTLGICVFTVK